MNEWSLVARKRGKLQLDIVRPIDGLNTTLRNIFGFEVCLFGRGHLCFAASFVIIHVHVHQLGRLNFNELDCRGTNQRINKLSAKQSILKSKICFVVAFSVLMICVN
jgi:hypothetical protein